MSAETLSRALFPRQKPRRLHLSLGYRSYYAVRAILPGRIVLRGLLEGAWLLRQLAWEHTWYSMAPAEAMALTRGHVPRFIRDNVPPGASVIDLGGGSGIASRAAAAAAQRIVYVDRSEPNASEARTMCAGLSNIEVVVGDALDVLGKQGPFDVALLLHVLGYHEDPTAYLARVRAHARRILVETPDFTADPLNALRLREVLSCYSDPLYRVEFSADHLETCIREAGFRLNYLQARNGCLLAVADASFPP